MTTPPADIVDQHRATIVENASDTCDQCGPTVTAYVFAGWPNGRALSYCGHHGTQHADALRTAGATVVDYTEHIPA